ncbi:MAG TPA: MaoC family dehydratase N-terminal domain-containing protein [Terriglobales bacterium]|nr:MaoC family dehydratase N-terminal domain-containing protein [Terriglobales bacterium]
MNNPLYPPYEVFVGRDLGGRDYRIEEDLIDRFRRGTADDDPRYRQPDPDGRLLAPALLFHSEVYQDLSWYLPNLIGNLHAAQEWELFQPMFLGDKVRTRSTVVGRYRKRNRDYVVNEVLITDEQGRWLQRSRTHQSFLAEHHDAGYVVDKERERQPDRAVESAAASGPLLAPIEKTITLEMCQAFSGPHRNYHTDREMAQALGFPDVVVQGMMSICFLSEMLSRNFGWGWFFGGKLEVKLINVVWPGDALTIGGRVLEEAPEGGRRRAHLEVWCEKADGVRTVAGSASALL